MALFIYILLIVLGWLLKKNKGLYILMSLYMFFLLAFRTGGADYDVYFSRFNWYSEFSGFTEILFTKYITLFHSLNLTFESFIGFSALLCILVPLIFIFKESTYPCRVLSMYMLYSFPIDGVQIRSTLGFGVVLIGLIYLKKNTKRSELIYFISIVIAAIIHSASIIYIALLPINRLKKRNLSWKIGAIFLGELVFIYFLRNVLVNSLSGSSILNVTYLMSHAANDDYRIFMYIVKSLIMFAVEYGLLELYRRNCLIKTEESIKKLDFVNKLNFITLFVIPLYFFSVDLYRIQRYLFIFSLIVIFGTKFKSSKNKHSYLLLSVLGFGIIYFLYFIRSTDYTSTIIPLLFGNSII